LRDYLEARYQEPATAMTSQEVSRLVKSKTSDLTTATSVREILSRADLVKFARIKPQENEGTRDVETVRAIIAATTPIVADATSSP
jgi:UDP-glucose 6-dehydrogenase